MLTSFSKIRRGIRKFGLAHHDLPTTLRNVTMSLEHLTLDVDPRNKRPIGILPYICMTVFYLCYHYIYVVSMIWFAFVKCKQTGDLVAALVVFSLGMISQISNLKLLNLMAYRKNLRDLIGDFLAFDALILPGTRFAANVKTKLKEVKKRALILTIVLLGNGTLYIIKPFVVSGQEDSLELLGLENKSRTSSSPGQVIFMMDSISVFGVCYSSSAISSLFIIIAGYIEAQMLALSHELTNVWHDALAHCNSNSTRVISHIRRPSRTYELEDSGQKVLLSNYTANVDNFGTAVKFEAGNNISSSSNISKQKNRTTQQDVVNKYVRKRLEDIAKTHSINVDLVHKMEEVFRMGIALEFLVLSIGLIACLLGGLDNTFVEMPIILMSVGIDCVTGQRIKDASMSFERAVYDSKWENFDVINRKMILLILRESQKTLSLSAGAVATLSLECFMNVLKTIYSAYTALRSTMK